MKYEEQKRFLPRTPNRMKDVASTAVTVAVAAVCLGCATLAFWLGMQIQESDMRRTQVYSESFPAMQTAGDIASDTDISAHNYAYTIEDEGGALPGTAISPQNVANIAGEAIENVYGVSLGERMIELHTEYLNVGSISHGEWFATVITEPKNTDSNVLAQASAELAQEAEGQGDRPEDLAGELVPTSAASVAENTDEAQRDTAEYADTEEVTAASAWELGSGEYNCIIDMLTGRIMHLNNAQYWDEDAYSVPPGWKSTDVGNGWKPLDNEEFSLVRRRYLTAAQNVLNRYDFSGSAVQQIWYASFGSEAELMGDYSPDMVYVQFANGMQAGLMFLWCDGEPVFAAYETSSWMG